MGVRGNKKVVKSRPKQEESVPRLSGLVPPAPPCPDLVGSFSGSFIGRNLSSLASLFALCRNRLVRARLLAVPKSGQESGALVYPEERRAPEGTFVSDFVGGRA